jgi:hypothetical protein
VGKRRTWHKIVDSTGNARPRQVVVAEICQAGQEQYYYLLEMELKPGESGQCTVLLYTANFAPLDEKIFGDLLLLTAIQNRWPDRHNKWKEAKDAARAKSFFANVHIDRINHPPVPRAKRDDKLSADSPSLNPKLWGQVLLEKIAELLPKTETI